MKKTIRQKFETYDSTTRIVINIIELLEIKITKTAISDSLHNHPDYPSLLSISDALNKWDIENTPVRVELDKLPQLPSPFISFLNGQFITVKEVSLQRVKYFNGLDEIEISLQEFTEKWKGIVLLVEPKESSGEENYQYNRKREIQKFLTMPAAFGIGILVILLWTFFSFRVENSISFVIFHSLMLFVKWMGIAVTAILLWYEIDKKNSFIQKICSGIAKANCSAVLSSREAKLFGIISWSEIGFFYFAFGFLSLLFNPTMTWLITLLNLCALPYIFFSIFYQWRVAKQWCILCLSVQALLLIECTLNILSGHIKMLAKRLITDDLVQVPFVLSVLLIPIGLWYFVKPQLKGNVKAKELKRELNRFKFNDEIFYSLLRKQKNIKRPEIDIGIVLGNSEATHTLIKVCNPYCGPCAKAHAEIENLIKQCSNLKVQIIFNVTSHENDFLSHPVRHLLAISDRGDKLLTAKALDVWYLAEKKDYEKFALLYPVSREILVMQDTKIDQMATWCNDIEIEFTPTIFYQGNQLPKPYNISDLVYFITE